MVLSGQCLCVCVRTHAHGVYSKSQVLFTKGLEMKSMALTAMKGKGCSF